MYRLLAGLLCLLLTACGSGDSWDPSAFAPAGEDRLVIYTSHPESVYGPLVKEFEERTGLWVQVETGGTTALLDRLAEEADAPKCDLLFGGGADSLTASSGLFEPYITSLTDEIDPACRCAGGSWTPFSVFPVVLVYNPVLVRMNPPEGWESLLNPVWRGRIAFASPAVSGCSYTALAAMAQILPQEDVLEAFYRNLDGKVLPEIDSVVDEVAATVTAVAEGSCTIGITAESAALEAIRAGRDLAVVYPAEGTCASTDGMAVIRGCAHPENARRFIDFAVGADAQAYMARTCMRRPVRTDLARETEEGLVLMDYDLDRAASEREEILARWKALEEAS